MWCNIGFGDELTLARTQATKSNINQVIKYIAANDMMCKLGEKTTMGGNLICSDKTPNSVVYAAELALTQFKNPYTGYNGIIISKRNIIDEDVGNVFISASGSNVIVKACFKKPCSQENNQGSTTIEIK